MDNSTIVKKLDKLEKAIEVLAQSVVTKEDAKHFATKDDIKNFATKDDITNLVTKDDLKNFTTKDDLLEMEKRFEKRFVTKDDLKNVATKDDLQTLKKELIEYTDGWCTDLMTSMDKNKADEHELQNLKTRVRNLERKTAIS